MPFQDYLFIYSRDMFMPSPDNQYLRVLGGPRLTDLALLVALVLSGINMVSAAHEFAKGSQPKHERIRSQAETGDMVADDARVESRSQDWGRNLHLAPGPRPRHSRDRCQLCYRRRRIC